MNVLPRSDCSDGEQKSSSASPHSFQLFFSPPNKETNREPNRPDAAPLQCSHPHPGPCQFGEIIAIVYPPPPNHTHTPTHAYYLHLPFLHPSPPPPPSPLQNEMPVSDRLSQFADPCGTLPSRPGHCASPLLGKEARNYFYPPNTRIRAGDFKCLPSTLSGMILARCQTHYIDLSFSVFQ